MINDRDYSVDLIKIIACFSVVILHVFQPESQWTANNCIYLLGTCGIPLFFMMNGYLLYNKDLSLQYCSKKIKKIFVFMVPWVFLVGTLACVKKWSVEGYILTLGGVFNASGGLFHFWFMVALCIIYLLIGILNKAIEMAGGRKLQEIINIKVVVVGILILMEITWMVNVFLGINGFVMIRGIVWPEFRFITNVGYFMLGMAVRKGRWFFCRIFKRIGLLIFACSILWVEFADALLFHFKWASSYYDSIIVAIGCIALVSYICSLEFVKHKKIIENFVQLSMPTYILHPLIIYVVLFILRPFGLHKFVLSIVELLAILIIVPVITKILRALRMTFLIEL